MVLPTRLRTLTGLMRTLVARVLCTTALRYICVVLRGIMAPKDVLGRFDDTGAGGTVLPFRDYDATANNKGRWSGEGWRWGKITRHVWMKV